MLIKIQYWRGHLQDDFQFTFKYHLTETSVKSEHSFLKAQISLRER